jgi:hypothetical protein
MTFWVYYNVVKQTNFVYSSRRINCFNCVTHLEEMTWMTGKHQLTEAYAWFLADWGKRLCYKVVVKAFQPAGIMSSFKRNEPLASNR